MKILYVDQTGQLGGGELSLLDWLREKPKDAHVVLFEDGPLRPLLEKLCIPVSILPLGSLKKMRRESMLATAFGALPAIFLLSYQLFKLSGKFDLIYANSQKAFLVAALARRRSQPLIWHLRDLLTRDHFSAFLLRIAVFAGNSFATSIIANSDATAASFVERGGRREKVTVIPDGVDSAIFDAIDLKRAAELRRLICPDVPFVIGFFGRLAEWKGQHVLLEALSSLPGIHALLVGDALFGEREYADSLVARAQQLDLVGRIHFLGFRKDIPELMKSVDLVVHASIAAEPLGRVIIEGMLARRPVIATRAGGAVEIVSDPSVGMLVEPRNIVELRVAIKRLQEDPVLRQQLAEAGYRHARQEFALSKMVGRITQVLDRVRPPGTAPIGVQGDLGSRFVEKRILYLDQTGQMGGGEFSLLDWLRVRKKGAEAILFGDGPFRVALEGIGLPVEVLPGPFLEEIRRESSLWSIARKIPQIAKLRSQLARRSRNYDLLYANSQKAFLLAALAKRSNQPLVWHLRDLLTPEHFSFPMRKIAILAANHYAAVIIANSQATANAFIKGGGRPAKVRVVHNGLDSQLFDAIEEETVIQLRAGFCPDSCFLIGHFGRISPWKGQHVLLEAISSIPEARVLLVGDPMFGERHYASTLRQRAQELDLAGRVHFLGHRSDVHSLMKSVDVVAHTSIAAEPFGRVIVEGMLARRPVIATRAGGVIEIIEDGVTGLFVNPGSAKELREALQTLRDNQDLSSKLAQAGYDHARHVFSLDRMITRIDNIIEVAVSPVLSVL